MRHETKDEVVTIWLEGRIDTNNAPQIEQEIEGILSENEGAKPAFDAGGLEYISSAGLRVLMKFRKQIGEPLEVTNVSSEVYSIFETTGFTDLFEVKKGLRQISIEGCELLGEGGNGAVYRLDPETIVKVYYGTRNDLEKINRNRELTKKVFLQGVPTTIAFDTVKVGEDYGVVYEMIDAKSLMQEMASHPEKIDHYANMIADTLKKLHSTEFEEGALPDSRDTFKNDVKESADAGYYSPEEVKRLYKLADDIPYRNTFIHQDFHPGNLMLQNDEIVLIDVEDAGLGHPVLDLSSMYLVYVTAAEKGWSTKFNVKKEDFDRAWDIIIKKYFDTTDEKKITEINRILCGYSMVKFIRGIATSPTVPDEVRKPAIDQAKEGLFKMIDMLHPIPITKA